ncbi:hypothetical protein HAX54_022814 [Datura stramonium]|uniref:Transmembrane protein n=1 Tax=Datura stramonium TaxID=4076 RepID=A0ABS8UV44_DATST|nr:hypothetical protein [Datura stramonium]
MGEGEEEQPIPISLDAQSTNQDAADRCRELHVQRVGEFLMCIHIAAWCDLLSTVFLLPFLFEFPRFAGFFRNPITLKLLVSARKSTVNVNFNFRTTLTVKRFLFFPKFAFSRTNGENPTGIFTPGGRRIKFFNLRRNTKPNIQVKRKSINGLVLSPNSGSLSWDLNKDGNFGYFQVNNKSTKQVLVLIFYKKG